MKRMQFLVLMFAPMKVFLLQMVMLLMESPEGRCTLWTCVACTSRYPKQSEKAKGLTLALLVLILLPLLACWLALGSSLDVLTKNESAARCAALDAVTIWSASPFNSRSQPFKYAAELSSVLSIPASAQLIAGVSACKATAY
jgi:hypothetical protein